MRRLIAIAALPFLGIACGGDVRPDGDDEAGGGAAAAALDVEALGRLYRARGYFTLRERLGDPGAAEPPEVRVLRAAAAHSFNEPERSNAILEAVLAGSVVVSDSLRYEAQRLRFRNLLRLQRYRDARRVLSELLADTPAFVDSSRVTDFRNMVRFTESLADVPPQRVVSRAPTTLSRLERGRVEVAIGDSVRHYAIDTGANFSVLIRSEAEALGLDVRPAGVEVGTSTDVVVTADVAVAERVALGGIELRDVVFLVLPDAMFTFPGFTIRGILGFPVLEALGELRFRRDGPIEVPAEVPDREVDNLALHQLTPLVRVGYDGDDLVCQFDTGADETDFHEPFYRRYRTRIEATGTPDTVRVGGAGGIRELPGYRMTDVPLRLGDAVVTLPEAHVHTRVLTEDDEDNVLDCRLGLDVLANFAEYVINFRSMSLLLR